MQTDDTGYASGLRYMNNRGIKFQKIEPPEDLPCGLPGQYGFQLDQTDGSKEYFDVYGKPLEHHDVYGNYIYYAYQGAVEGGIDNPGLFLDYVQDSWGQIIQCSCDIYEWTVTLPDGSFTSLSLTEEGVLSVTDPAALSINFEYVNFDGNSKVLSIITYPTGLTSRYDHRGLQYWDHNGRLRKCQQSKVITIVMRMT